MSVTSSVAFIFFYVRSASNISVVVAYVCDTNVRDARAIATHKHMLKRGLIGTEYAIFSASAIVHKQIPCRKKIRRGLFYFYFFFWWAFHSHKAKTTQVTLPFWTKFGKNEINF